MAALGQFSHRALAPLTGIGDYRPNACGLEENPLADAIPRDLYVTRFQACHHFGDNGQTSDDNVGTVGVEAFYGAAFRRLHCVQHLQEMLDVTARDTGRMNAARREDSLLR
jgi:hypothetical protein